MKKPFIVLLVLILLCCTQIASGGPSMNDKPNPEESVIFPKGDRVPVEYFTGLAWAAPLVLKDDTFSCPVYNVTFDPGARNNWHKHPGGQILLVTGGKGYFQERGKAARLLQPGDVVTIPPNIEHWHGATSDSRFTHLAISTNIQKGDAQWLERVSDQEYVDIQRPAVQSPAMRGNTFSRR